MSAAAINVLVALLLVSQTAAFFGARALELDVVDVVEKRGQ